MLLLLGLVLASALQDPGFDNLAARMDSRDPKIRREAAKLLGESADHRAVPVLGKAVKDLDEETRYRAVEGLGILVDRDAIPFMAEAIKDPSRRVKQSAVAGLVTEYISTKGPGGIKSLLVKPVEIFRRSGDDLIVAPGTPVDPQVIAALGGAVSDPDNEVAKDAARALGILRGAAAVPAMAKALYDAPNSVKVELLKSFQKIRDPKPAPEIARLLANNEKEVRGQAAYTLGLLGAKDQREALRNLFQNDGAAEVRRRAFEGLSLVPDPADASFFAGHLADKDGKLRELSADAFGRLPHAAIDKASEEALRTRFRDEKNGRVKLALCFALTAQGYGEYLRDLMDALDSAFNRQYGVTYLTELGRDASRLPAYYPYLHVDKAGVRRSLCDVFTNLGNPAALEQVRPLINDSNQDVVTAAIRAVQTMERAK